MGIFDSPGQYDETSPFYFLRDQDARALDQAIKARRAAEATAAAVRAAVPVAPGPSQERRIEALEHNLLALGLYARTLLSVLQDKGLITADEFSERIRQIDLLDGRLDQR